MCAKICLTAFIIITNTVLISGSRLDAVKQCCTSGSESAATEPSCTFTEPLDAVEEQYRNLCLSSMEKCCKTKQKELDCVRGIEDAKSGNSCTAEESRGECCEACKLGLETKDAGEDCDAAALGVGTLFDETMVGCCKTETETSTPKTSTPATLTTKPSTSNTPPKKPYRTTLKNMCGISDTCAQLCIPEGNAFRCDCRKGYTLMKDGVSCKPSRVPTKPNRCKPNPCEQKCQDTGTSVQCSCSEGFELNADGIHCDDIDECELGTYQCPRNEMCINYPGYYECFDPDKAIIDEPEETDDLACPDGFRFNSKEKLCDDINECEFELICPRPQLCENTVGSYKCVGSTTLKCPPGFYFNSDQQSCEDVDECALSTDDCNRQSQKCLNTKGNFTCVDKASKASCPPGFKKDASVDDCVDVDECEENADICEEGETCLNEPGRYSCVPSSSSTSIASTTTARTTAKTTIPTTSTTTTTTEKVTAKQPDIENEISSFGPPLSKATTSLPKSKTYKPTTAIGPKGPGACQRGYKQIGGQCVDINECLTETACDSNQECFNTEGGFQCRCKTGFTKEYVTGACVDVNECQIGTHDCMDGQRCDNTVGSFLCSRTSGCGTGYTLNYQTGICEDDDECVLETHNCRDLGPEFACRNTLGSYRCEKVRPQTAKPILPTTRQPLSQPQPPGISGVYNFLNGQLMRCLPGYRRNFLGECEDIDECEIAPCPRGFKCLNAKGSFHCVSGIQCGPGMEPDKAENRCVDIDECARGLHKCKSNQICKNQKGFYICVCPFGHQMNLQYECEDIDECKTFKGRYCDINANCRNTIGSFSCECNKGFYKNGQICDDINECKKDNQLCEQTCVNLWGGYRCSCKQGYTMNADNRTCTDLNECEMFKDKNLCIGTCENIPGSYRCTCPSGYKLSNDGRICNDIDECSLIGCPDHTDICVNTRGGYRCEKVVCPPNYIRDPEHKSQCKKAANVCDPRSTSCNLMPESYSYFFVSFGSNLPIPRPVEFLRLRAPDIVARNTAYNLKVMDVQCPRRQNCANEGNFQLMKTGTGANLAIVRSIEGPQDIEIELEMRVSIIGHLPAVRVSKIFMFVSEYIF